MGRSVIGDTIKRNAGRPRWEPKFPGFAEQTPTETLEPFDERKALDNNSVPWQPAPATSHLLAFRYFPRSKMTNFGRDVIAGEQANKAPLPQGQTRVQVRANSVIMIRFKPSGRRGVTEYHYYYPDENESDNVWKLLTEAEHPGEVVLHMMIPAGTSYRRVS
ncbi:hypothetical protein BH11PLA2_BH11PLA2_32470 [soil metagenome]